LLLLRTISARCPPHSRTENRRSSDSSCHAGRTENEVATHILVREAYVMHQRGFHEQRIPAADQTTILGGLARNLLGAGDRQAPRAVGAV